MLRINTGELGIAQGDEMLVTDFDTSGPLWTDEGEREVRAHVDFAERFLRPPAVHLGVTMWDLDSQRNQRGDLRAENVTAAGFDIVFHSWGDTRIARMRVSWTAIGPTPDDDDFVL